jgi:hypothetical protein
MAKRFCGNEFAWGKGAMRFSSSAHTVTADTDTAAPNVATKLAAGSGGPPTDATKRAPRDGSITATASVRTAAAFVKRNRA